MKIFSPLMAFPRNHKRTMKITKAHLPALIAPREMPSRNTTGETTMRAHITDTLPAKQMKRAAAPMRISNAYFAPARPKIISSPASRLRKLQTQ
jgi:hypothetical protein